MLKFKKAEARANSLKTIGTVAQFVGVNGKYELASEKNFKGTIDADGNKILKKVSIKLINKAGDDVYVNCSGPVGTYLRDSASPEELKERLAEIGSLPILELPQVERDENSPNFGQPIMVIDKETQELVPLILYSISNAGGKDMSATSIAITDEMLEKEISARAINFEDLVAL